VEAKDLELLVFLDGIDAMTSNNMSARHSYYFSDLRVNQTFSTIYLRATRKGKVGLDLAEFDQTLPAGEGACRAAGLPGCWAGGRGQRGCGPEAGDRAAAGLCQAVAPGPVHPAAWLLGL
jgi:hypothetical protein